MGWDDFRKRNEEIGARIARRPFATWALYSVLFSGFSLLINLPHISSAEWIYALTGPPIIAAGVVAGTVIGHRVRQRRGRGR